MFPLPVKIFHSGILRLLLLITLSIVNLLKDYLIENVKGTDGFTAADAYCACSGGFRPRFRTNRAEDTFKPVLVQVVQ